VSKTSTIHQATRYSLDRDNTIKHKKCGENELTDYLAASVVDGVKSEASKTGTELRGLKDAKVTPSQTTSTGQPLTRMYQLTAGIECD
jgi:hypothetical protein